MKKDFFIENELADRIRSLSSEKRELLELLLSGQETGKDSHVEPRNSLERALAELWKEVLGIGAVGVQDDYFALGGDSISIIRIVTKARAQGIPLSVADMFDYPQIGALAVQLASREAQSVVPADTTEESRRSDLHDMRQRVAAIRSAEELSIVDIHPLTPLQLGILYHVLRSGRSGVYVVQWECRLSGAIDLEAFRQALSDLTTGHPALRSVFHWEGLLEPVQVVLSAAPVDFRSEDWRSFDVDAQRRKFEDESFTDRTEGYDLQNPPLMRVRVFRIGTSEWRLLWSHHHLIMDGWSQDILLERFLRCYETRLRGSAFKDDLSFESGSYARFVKRQSAIQSKELWSLRPDWVCSNFSEEKAGETQMPAVVPDEQQSIVRRLDEHTAARIRKFAQEQSGTVGHIFGTAWALVQAHFSENPRVTYGLTCSGRSGDFAGIENAVGMFINTLPVWAEVRGWDKLQELFSEVRRRHLDVLRNEMASISELARFMGSSRSESLCQSILVYNRFSARGFPSSSPFVIEDLVVRAREDCPLVCVVNDGAELTVTIKFEADTHARETAERMMSALLKGVESIPTRIDESVRVIQADVSESDALLRSSMQSRRRSVTAMKLSERIVRGRKAT